MNYDMLTRQVRELAAEEPWYVPLLANVSALLYEALPDLNWAGFYLMRDGRLVLGPFQGKAACIHIGLSRGVCGAAARENRTQRVADVHSFPGHIACDGASNAEIVVPLRQNGRVIGVLDLDSPLPNRFTPDDQAGLEAVAKALEEVVRISDADW